MLYFANVSGSLVREAMAAGQLGQIVTPAEGRQPVPGAVWVADNSAFAGRYPGDEGYLRWLAGRQHLDACRFATAPDVLGDAAATLERSRPMLRRIRALVPVAYIGQDGAQPWQLPWQAFDALFIGGSTEWKLSPDAVRLVTVAKRRGLWVHMGRVNSVKRLRYAHSIGCDSVDGTYLTYGPDVNLPRLLRFLAPYAA